MSVALPEALFFTGIDWAAQTHAVCVMDAGGKIGAGFTIEHSADGIAALVRRLARYGIPGDMPVAIERPNGRLVDLLLEAWALGGTGQPERDQDLAGRRGAVRGQVRRRRMPR